MRIDIFIRGISLSAIAMVVASCAAPDTQHHVVISTREQKLALLDQGNLMAIYPVSTSKFGLGDFRGVGEGLFFGFDFFPADFGLAVGLGDSSACASCRLCLPFSSSLTWA